jgi:MFS family permease
MGVTISPMSDAPAQTDPYAPWRYRDFRCYALSWFAVTFSKQMERVVIGQYFVDIFVGRDAPLALGLVGLVQALPVILLAIPGGQLADRLDRRGIMIAMLALGTLAATGLLGVTLSGGSVPWIFVCLGLGAVAQAIGSPSRAALLPQLVPSAVFPKAVAWNSSVFYTAMVTGPLVGGVIMWMTRGPSDTVQNPSPTLAVVLACRLVALASVTLVHRHPVERREQSVSWESVLAGIRFVWRTKVILATITLDMFAVLLGGAVYLLPVFAKEILHVGPVGFGLLCAADAVGAVSMGVAQVHLPPLRRAGVALLWAVAGFGLATVIFGLSQWFWLSLLMMFMVGALDNISVVVRHTLVQMLTPDSMRGRVSAVNGVFIVASNDLGGLESGLTAWLFGPVISVVAGGIGTILVVLATMRLWPQILAIGSLDAIKPVEEEEETEELADRY